MGYAVTYNDLLQFKWSLQGASGQLFETLSNIGESFRQFIDMESFQGATAENMKSYISEVSTTISASFQVALQELNDKYLFYKDGYGNIDNNVQFVLTEDKFIELLNFYRNSEYRFDPEDRTAQRVLNDVSDIRDFPRPRPYNVLGAYQQTGQRVNDLMVRVGEYETSQASNALSLFADIMGPLKALISEYAGKSGNSALRYQSGDIGQSKNIQALAAALQTAIETHEANADELAAIRDREDLRFEELEAIWAQERAEQGILNFLVGALVVVGGIVCIVATAGLATPFVVAGAVAGMATIAYGYSNMIEAGQDIVYGFSGDWSTAAFNPLRDTIFQGNQEAWDTFGTIAIATSSVLTLGAGAISAGSAAAKAGTSVVRAVGVYGGKVGLGMAGGYLGSIAGKETATYFGASETVSEIFGVLGGTAGGMLAGMGAEKLDSKYNISGLQTQKITDPRNLKPGGGPDEANYYNAKTNPNGEAPGGGFTLDSNGNPIKEPTYPTQGQQLDRYGDPNGRYVSPVGESGPESFSSRSLPQAENPYARHQYEVVRNFDELPNNMVAQSGKAAPAFGQPGGATQLELPLKVNQLIKLGFLKDVTPVNYFQTIPGILAAQNAANQLAN